jgi:uncharacterized phage protein (TIGR02218 family)
MALDYTANPTYFAHALRLERHDGQVFGFTEHDMPAAMDVVYTEDQGLTATSIMKTAGTDVGTLEITTLNDGSLFTLQDILGQVWRNAEFLIFRYNWANLGDGIDPLLAGTIGEIRILGTELKIELRDRRQALQQEIGNKITKTCRYRLGSTNILTGGFCLKDISGPIYTHTGSVTVAGQVTVTTTLSAAVDFFGEGTLEWTSGENEGQVVKIGYFSGGVVQFSRPLFGLVQVGDAFIAVAGCRKRFTEDCVTKFANGINFGGEKDATGINTITASPV